MNTILLDLYPVLHVQREPMFAVLVSIFVCIDNVFVVNVLISVVFALILLCVPTFVVSELCTIVHILQYLLLIILMLVIIFLCLSPKFCFCTLFLG